MRTISNVNEVEMFVINRLEQIMKYPIPASEKVLLSKRVLQCFEEYRKGYITLDEFYNDLT